MTWDLTYMQKLSNELTYGEIWWHLKSGKSLERKEFLHKSPCCFIACKNVGFPFILQAIIRDLKL